MEEKEKTTVLKKYKRVCMAIKPVPKQEMKIVKEWS